MNAPSEPDRGGAVLPDPPRRRISPWRAMCLLLVLAAGLLLAGRAVGDSAAARTGRGHMATVYQPYVDTTLTPTYPFQSPAADPVSDPVLGFIVTTPAHPCEPTWGGYYTLSGASSALDLDARIAQLRAQGGQVTLSFGGEANEEPAASCTSPSALQSAYLTPIERYGVSEIDLDVEGASLADTAADARRATAIQAVQQQLAGHGRTLRVWLTLPVADTGLTAQGTAAVRAMLAAHVRLAGVNVMAMDFGSGEGAEHAMYATVQAAVQATHRQMMALDDGAGVNGSSAAAWQHLGVTVMLGQNDVPGEVFGLRDAQRLVRFATREGLARVSAWSLNRDAPCGGAFVRDGVVSNLCSGVTQAPLAFTRVLGRLRGTDRARAQTAAAPAVAPTAGDTVAGPYPVWTPAAGYPAGFKVVWQGAIYQAQWWNEAAPPDAAPTEASQAPWLLIGPVPPGSHGVRTQLLRTGVRTVWSPTRNYPAGSLVSVDGLPFRARWYSRDVRPLTNLPAEPQSPWTPLFVDRGEPRSSAS